MPLTDLTFLQTGAQWPPPSERPRMDRYRRNRALWKGFHDQVYGDWWRVLREDKSASLEMVFNWHKRISTLWADLLVGEPPRFLDGMDAEKPPEVKAAKRGSEDKPEDKTQGKADAEKTGSPTGKPKAEDKDEAKPHAPSEPTSSPRQEALDRISGKDDNGYVTTLYEVALDVSRYGDGLVKVTLEEEGAQIWCQPPTYWFPVVHPANMRKVQYHVLAWEFSTASQQYQTNNQHYYSGTVAPDSYTAEHPFLPGEEKHLWVEIHSKGSVSTSVYSLAGDTLGEPMDPKMFDAEAKAFEETMIDDFLVVPFAGLRASDEMFGQDDYVDLDSVVQAIEVRAGQINRVLDKHTDPSMYGPSDQLETDPGTGVTVFKASDRYFEVDEDDVPPGYVTWDGQLEAQFKELEFLIEQLYVISETSPAAFGQLKEGLVESGSALRRLMQAPLAKVARITMRFDPAAKRALKIAAELERAHGRETPEIEKIQIQWQDGLPPDPKEQAETEQIRTGNQATSSLASAIRRLDGGTQEDAEKELERISEESQLRADAALETAKEEAALAQGQEENDPRKGPPRQTEGRQSRVNDDKEKN